jgi:YQGE family putative transporter
MNRLRREIEAFLECPRSMQVLLLANMIYALVLPVIEIFVAAYVMRNSHEVGKVVAYQLSVYASTPVAFFLNGILLGRVDAKHLYAAGMVLSGVAILMLMRTTVLTPLGITALGLALGLAIPRARYHRRQQPQLLLRGRDLRGNHGRRRRPCIGWLVHRRRNP